MILDLNDVQEKKETQGYRSKPSSPVLRIWYNTLLEFTDEGVEVLQSYSSPAKDSDIKRHKKPKKNKKSNKKVDDIKIQEEEVY